jgi:tetratricopeptide (TPR) repeat protein
VVTLECTVLLSLLLAAPGTGVAAPPSRGPTPVEAIERQLQGTTGVQRVGLLLRLAEAADGNDFRRTLSSAEEALRLAQESGDARSEARALYYVGRAKAFLGQAEEAIAPLTRARDLSRGFGDVPGVARATNTLGIAEYRRGHFAQAASHFAAALAMWRQVGDIEKQADVLSNLGSVSSQQGDFRKGGEYFEQSLALQRRLGNVEGEALALNNLGIVRQHTADYAGAVDAYLKALAIEERRGHRPGISRALTNLSVVYKNLGRLNKAAEYARRAVETDRQTGDRHSLATSLEDLGSIQADQGNYEAAVQSYTEGLAIARALDNPTAAVSLLVNLGDAREHAGRFAESRRAYAEAIHLADTAGLKARIAYPLIALSRSQRRDGDIAGARHSLERALRAAKTSQDRELLRDTYEAQAETFAAGGDYRPAYEAYVRYVAEHDAILNKEANDRIAEMEARFAAEKKAREIEILKRDNEIQRLRLRSARLRTYVLLVGLGAAVLLMLLLWRRHRHLLAFWRSRSHVGAYRILKEIGSGGIGVVYKAVHVRDRSRPVAIKLLRPELSEDPTLRQRLRNEAALIDQINHPNIVRVIERGESNNKLYIVMEWLDGRTLAQVVRSGERLPLSDCLAIMRQLADAVARMHASGVVHRDLKPENVMLIAEDGEAVTAKLLDFDVARSGGQARLTETGFVVGTMGYMAPERITRQATTPESDTFALGAVFYEALTFEKPFFGETAAEVVRNILDAEPLAPQRLRPELPTDLSDLVLQMLAKDPSARPNDDILIERLAALEMRAN